MNWNVWITRRWSDLVAGHRLVVPAWLPHPSAIGFEQPPIAEPAGQVCDWVMSIRDGSRLHVHECHDGRLVIHRDDTDPKRGPLHALWHWATESVTGRLTLAAVGGGACGAVIAMMLDED